MQHGVHSWSHPPWLIAVTPGVSEETALSLSLMRALQQPVLCILWKQGCWDWPDPWWQGLPHKACHWHPTFWVHGCCRHWKRSIWLEYASCQPCIEPQSASFVVPTTSSTYKVTPHPAITLIFILVVLQTTKVVTGIECMLQNKAMPHKAMVLWALRRSSSLVH